VAYLYGLFIVALLLWAIHTFTELDKKQKSIIAALLVLFIAGAFSYNKYQDIQREKMLAVIVKYKQGKTILCDDREVNASNYSLSIGTYTFIGKKNTPHYAEMIDAYQCQ
jgi:hypothetical protein